MTDVPEPGNEQAEGQEQQPPYMIEGARSSRSKCKTCRRKIDKGSLRLGILVEGPYGIGYMWHHLNCAARRRLSDVEQAYENEAWNEAKEPPTKLPSIDKLRQLQEQAEERKKTRKKIPYVEPDPSGRAKCKHCDKPIEKGSLRIVLGREVEFGNQVRVGPINVHPACVVEALDVPDAADDPAELAAALRENTRDLSAEQVEAAITEIGDLS